MGKSSRRKKSVDKKKPIDQVGSQSPYGSDSKGDLRRQLIFIVVIVVLGFLTYSNTFQGPFQFDEDASIIHNPVIKDLKNFTAERKGYDYNPRRFIGYLSFALNYHLGGIDVIGYHVFNLLIHIANALLVYFLVLLVFRTPYFNNQQSAISNQQSADGNNRFIALFSALFFVAHPVQTQAVTYVVQRFTSLATMWYLLSVVMYIKGRQEAIGRGQGVTLLSPPLARGDVKGGVSPITYRLLPIAYYLLSLLFAILAMKTKEISFTLPVIVILCEFIFFKAPLKKKLIFLIPVLLTIAIIPISLMHSNKSLGEALSDLSAQTRIQTNIPRLDYLMTELRVIVTYMRLLFFPMNQNLDYDYPIYHSFFTPPVFLSFLLLAALLGMAVWMLYRSRRVTNGHVLSAFSGQLPYGHAAALYRLIAFGIFWFFITLSVESSIIPIADVIFEHRIYLPSVGFFTAIVAGLFVAAKRLKLEKIVIPVLVFVTLLFSGLTYARNAIWNDQLTLWQDVAEKSPNKARPHNNLGIVYAARGQVDMALAEYKRSLRLSPDYADAHNNLGGAYASRGQWDKAIPEFQTALQLRPDNADAHNNLGYAYALRGQTDRAIVEYQAALRLSPDLAEAHNNMGLAYGAQGRWDKAIAEYQAALRLKPAMEEAHYNLGLAYESQGQWDVAMEEYQEALRLNPADVEARQRLNDIILMRR